MEVLDDKTLGDLECLMNGAFSPLSTFMCESDYNQVCENLHLENGNFFPLPITLAVKKQYNIGDTITLVDSTNFPLAKLNISDVYQPDIEKECLLTMGTTDDNHPYVKYKYTQKGFYYLSGKLEKLNDVRHYDFKDLRRSVEEVREILSNKKSVVGFQTRNPMHRAHYELTQYALEQAGEDSFLFLNPVVGETQSVDIDYHTRVKVYQSLLPRYNGRVLLNLLPLTMRMAGPREACLHALIRKNYGCTHFVVGRDHAGPSFKTKDGNSFYGPYDAQNLLDKHKEEIGIKVILSKMIVFNKTREEYMPIDVVPSGEEVLTLSGTEVRKRLLSGEEIPDWFSYPEVVELLRKERKGVCYYFVGLSGSGKTTLANGLKTKLLEQDSKRAITILDGDVVRQNLAKGLGFSKEDRSVNVRRIGYVASEIVKHGGTVICANIAPYEEDRLFNRELIGRYGRYIEIFVNTSLEVCEERDVKGLYKLARQGVIKQFTGISDPFEEPERAELVVNEETIEESLTKILDL